MYVCVVTVYAITACVFSSQITFETNGHYPPTTKETKGTQTKVVSLYFLKIGSQVAGRAPSRRKSRDSQPVLDMREAKQRHAQIYIQTDASFNALSVEKP